MLKLPIYINTVATPPHLFAVPPETKGCGGIPDRAGSRNRGTGVRDRQAKDTKRERPPQTRREPGRLSEDRASWNGDRSPRRVSATLNPPVIPSVVARMSSVPPLVRPRRRSTRIAPASTRPPRQRDVSTPERNTFVPSLHLVRLYQLDVVGLDSDCERVFPTGDGV